MEIPAQLVCRTCTRVLVAEGGADGGVYTPARGRLIVARGYCLCPAPGEPSVDQPTAAFPAAREDSAGPLVPSPRPADAPAG
ncbi:hypothetical protein PS9374_05090 [Planomonospora sphaerica]|uniref:Uncharacterized protein n=3 Tax=Planomonospora TaxID=1998 RepID=A0A161LNR3_9ACTN|nr:MULTISPECIES: hypothetical protein [Planomonospora]GAT69415.1 hypothetical protein PS9374_05090 [Planomonospora sphaerica]GGK81716.1 hypothetical protein GCM10010126_46320 [Planomonospora parontospora]GII11030.1 hypothetical protein Ppa06_48280 [Planomonospora parontospora subsp. parontospora]